jgi:hypothetical protein
MERMAKHTKQPEMLRELFEALGNDPFVIAECLARHALATRLVTNWYAYDQRIHGELKQRAEAELRTHPTVEQMKQLSGKYNETDLIKSDNAGQEPKRVAELGMKLKKREWDETVQRLATMFRGGENDELQTSRAVAAGVSPAKGASITQIKTGILSPLQEDRDRYYITAVIEKAGDHLKLATVSWLKEPLESWRERAEKQASKAIAAATGSYGLPRIGDGCIDDTWTATLAPPVTRQCGRAAK